MKETIIKEVMDKAREVHKRKEKVRKNKEN
jgi:hypothetical protein